MRAQVAALLRCQLGAEDDDVRNEGQEAGEISLVFSRPCCATSAIRPLITIAPARAGIGSSRQVVGTVYLRGQALGHM